MTDRFKSRFFHKPTGKYLTQASFIYCDGRYHLVSTDIDSNPYILISLNESKIIEEQCTGLKDKNRKLIYEGDILQDCEQKIKVVFDEERHCFMFEYQRTRAYKPISCLDVLDGDYEIIGNIHENKDLEWKNEVSSHCQ